MKPKTTLFETRLLGILIALMLILIAIFATAQPVCNNPSLFIYGLSSNGEIYPINMNTAKTGSVVKNNSYAPTGPSSANGMGYNTFNSKFYYFKRNVTSGSQEFVSYTPSSGTVTVLSTTTTLTDDTHTGCVSYNGAGYYTIDVNGALHYYNIAANTWKMITNKIVDQFGNNISTLIQTQDAGDMAIDGLGNIWFLTSSTANYGLFKIPFPLPTTSVVQINAKRIINPATATPTGNSFAGIAFSPNGSIYLSTRGDDRLYVMTTPGNLTYIATLDRSDIGNDLTSCSFPSFILPVTWKAFDVAIGHNNAVTLSWTVEESENKGFYIEHSLNGSDWEAIGFVAARNGNLSEESYAYTHTNNLDGKQYYRIRQVDLDGRITYSEVRVITLKNNTQNITIWPNPATDQIRIAASGSNNTLTKAQIFDLSGRMLTQKKLSGNGNIVSIGDLPTGTYVIRVESADGTVYNQKVSKQ